jgi:hypothetical protein
VVKLERLGQSEASHLASRRYNSAFFESTSAFDHSTASTVAVVPRGPACSLFSTGPKIHVGPPLNSFQQARDEVPETVHAVGTCPES